MNDKVHNKIQSCKMCKNFCDYAENSFENRSVFIHRQFSAEKGITFHTRTLLHALLTS